MSGAPLFSIVIPTYNYAVRVANAVESACAQEGGDHEVIVIDDGSQDETPTVLAECSVRWPRVLSAVRQANSGVSVARNRGAKLACGDFLIFLDADDQLLPNALAEFRAALAPMPRTAWPGLLVAGRVSIFPDGQRKRHVPAPIPDERLAALLGYLRKQFALSNGAVAVRRDVALATPYPETLAHAEDIPVFAAIVANHSCKVINAPVVEITKHSNSRRHDASAALAAGLAPLTALFEQYQLPPAAYVYRRELFARRCLSIFRTCARAGRHDMALAYWRQALHYKARLAMQPEQLSRLLRLGWHRLRG